MRTEEAKERRIERKGKENRKKGKGKEKGEWQMSEKKRGVNING